MSIRQTPPEPGTEEESTPNQTACSVGGNGEPPQENNELLGFIHVSAEGVDVAGVSDSDLDAVEDALEDVLIEELGQPIENVNATATAFGGDTDAAD